MPNAVWIAIGTLALTVIVNIVTIAWWASRISTIMELLERTVSNITNEIKGMNSEFLTRDYFTERLGISDSKVEACFRKLDELREEVDTIKINCVRKHIRPIDERDL